MGNEDGERIIYGREELLLIGKAILSSNETYRVSGPTWNAINLLGLKTARKTKRGKRGGKKKREKLRCALINARSVCNKATEINDYITENNLDALFITETWLKGNGKDNVILAELLPPNFAILHNSRKQGRGGGVAVIHRKDISVKFVKSEQFDSFEHILTKFVTSSVTYHIITIYRPPPNQKNQLSSSSFLEEFADLLSFAILLKGELLINGDFNYHLNNTSNVDTQQFISLLESCNIKQHISDPTHLLGNTIDLLLTRSSDCGLHNIRVTDQLISDHFVVHFSLAITRQPRPTKTVNTRSYKKINVEALKSDIRNSKLSTTTLSDPDELAQDYNEVLSNLLDQHAPLKTRTVVIRPLAPWYDDTIEALRKEGRKAERRWRKTELTVHREIFKNVKNQLTNTIKSKKKSYLQDKINSADQSQQALFQCMNELLFKSKVTALPTDIPPEDQPDKFCNFFLEKIEKIQGIFTTPEDECAQATTPDQHLLDFDKATPEEIRKIIVKSPTKSCTLDPFPTFLLKNCLDEVVPTITAIINASLTSGKVPELFKKAVVTPLLKKSSLDPDVLANYRPVSNLSFISKILEKVVSKRLDKHKTAHDLYEPFQSAYRAGHSTETAVLRVQNDILRAIDDGNCVFLVLLDLSAAFDTVSHNIILKRLSSRYGVQGNAIKWIESYLTRRLQTVLVSGKYSEPAVLKYGVPQGSVLGPAFFTDYSAPVAALIRAHGVAVQCYADDTQLYVSFPPSDEAAALERLEGCIADLRTWMNRNRLKLNDSKTEFIIFGTRSRLANVKTKSVRVGDEEITAAKKVRNIGALFDSELKMDTQVKSMCRNAWLNLYNIGKIRNYLTVEQTKTVVHAYVTSKLDANNALLAGITSDLKSQLQRVQNAASKLITKTKKHDHATPLLYNLHWLPVEDRIVFKILLLTFKALNKVGPVYLKDLFTGYKPPRTLRSSDDFLALSIPRTTLVTYGDRAFSVAAACEWNKLPLHIRSSASTISFKSQLKTHLFEKRYKRK